MQTSALRLGDEESSSTSARLVATRAVLARHDELLNALFSAPRTLVVHGHMSNRLAIVSAENVDLVVKIVNWAFFEEFTALEEAVVVGDMNTEGRGICVDLGRTSRQ